MAQSLNPDDLPDPEAAEPVFENTQVESAKPSEQIVARRPSADRLQSETGAEDPVVLAKPGPGLLEAMLWTISVLIVHVFAGLFTIFAVYFLSSENPRELLAVLQDPNQFQQFIDTYMVEITAGDMGIFSAVVLLAVILRLGLRADRRLMLTRIPTFHTVLILCSFLPMSLLCGQLHLWAKAGWDRLVELAPILRYFSMTDTMDAIQPLAESASLPTLILILGVAPAISEELVFRGVIGRGLVARFGIVPGILLTSILFGAVHLHPAHAVALFPLAVMIHLAYLATRSFWAPVLIHFLNNSFAAVVLKLPHDDDVSAIASESELPLAVTISAAVSCVCAGILLWRSRMQWKLPDGDIWSPGFETVEAPPADLQAVPERRRVSTVCFVVAAVGIIQFGIFFGAHAVSVARTERERIDSKASQPTQEPDVKTKPEPVGRPISPLLTDG